MREHFITPVWVAVSFFSFKMFAKIICDTEQLSDFVVGTHHKYICNCLIIIYKCYIYRYHLVSDLLFSYPKQR